MNIRKITAAEGERILSVKIVDNGSAIEIQSISENQILTFEEAFPVINVQEIVNNEKLISFKPQSATQERVMKSIQLAKKINLPNFRAQSIAPAFSNETENGILYAKGLKPATDKSVTWWEDIFKEYMPEKNSRIGELLEYDIFLAYLIEELLNKGYDKTIAWHAICDNSSCLVPFAFLKDLDCELISTGNLQVGEYSDIGGTLKLVCSKKYFYTGKEYSTNKENSKEKYYLCSNITGDKGFGHIRQNYVENEEQPIYWTVGWMVMDE